MLEMPRLAEYQAESNGVVGRRSTTRLLAHRCNTNSLVVTKKALHADAAIGRDSNAANSVKSYASAEQVLRIQDQNWQFLSPWGWLWWHRIRQRARSGRPVGGAAQVRGRRVRRDRRLMSFGRNPVKAWLACAEYANLVL